MVDPPAYASQRVGTSSVASRKHRSHPRVHLHCQDLRQSVQEVVVPLAAEELLLLLGRELAEQIGGVQEQEPHAA